MALISGQEQQMSPISHATMTISIISLVVDQSPVKLSHTPMETSLLFQNAVTTATSQMS